MSIYEAEPVRDRFFFAVSGNTITTAVVARESRVLMSSVPCLQLRTKINAIKEDDRRILWEGVDSLNEEELQDACKIKL